MVITLTNDILSHFSTDNECYELEMGRSSADAEVRPKNSAECSARFGSATCDYSAEVRPNFGKHSASFVASHLRLFALAAGVN